MYWDNTIIFIKKLVQYFYKLLWQGKISLKHFNPNNLQNNWYKQVCSKGGANSLEKW